MLIRDIQLLESYTVQSQAKSKGGYIELQSERHLLPEEIMDKLSLFTGNGKNKITVGATLASNIEFGFTANSFVSVTAICGESIEEIEGTHNIIQPFVQKLCMDNHDRIAEVRDSMARDAGASPALVRANNVEPVTKSVAPKNAEVVEGPPKKTSSLKVKRPPKFNR